MKKRRSVAKAFCPKDETGNLWENWCQTSKRKVAKELNSKYEGWQGEIKIVQVLITEIVNRG